MSSSTQWSSYDIILGRIVKLSTGFWFLVSKMTSKVKSLISVKKKALVANYPYNSFHNYAPASTIMFKLSTFNYRCVSKTLNSNQKLLLLYNRYECN